MINSIRKFSTTPYAKILLFIVILPFVMWGMGDVFRSGKQNTIVEIKGKKISTQSFADFVNQSTQNEKINDSIIDTMLSSFIANNLIDLEYTNLKINITDATLAKIIKNNNLFFQDGVFSRNKYEKFLITNNISAVRFEEHIRATESKKQLFDFVAGGIKAPKFLINQEYDLINQIRDVSVINLNEIYKKDLNFTDDEINEYYKKNKNNFTEKYRSIEFSIISPETITEKKEYSNLFFSKLDEIEDSIASELNVKEISKKFNLSIIKSNFFNKNGKKENGDAEDKLSKEVIKKIFNTEFTNEPYLTNIEEKYFLIQIVDEKEIFKENYTLEVKNQILKELKRNKIISNNSDLLRGIIQNEFDKNKFDDLALKNNIKVENIIIKGIKDSSKIDKNFIKDIYTLPENKMYVFSDSELKNILLIYIDKIEHVKLNDNSDKFKNYTEQTNSKIISNLYNNYDLYIKNKYEIDINYNALERVKNFYK